MNFYSVLRQNDCTTHVFNKHVCFTRVTIKGLGGGKPSQSAVRTQEVQTVENKPGTFIAHDMNRLLLEPVSLQRSKFYIL